MKKGFEFPDSISIGPELHPEGLFSARSMQKPNMKNVLVGRKKRVETEAPEVDCSQPPEVEEQIQ